MYDEICSDRRRDANHISFPTRESIDLHVPRGVGRNCFPRIPEVKCSTESGEAGFLRDAGAAATHVRRQAPASGVKPAIRNTGAWVRDMSDSKTRCRGSLVIPPCGRALSPQDALSEELSHVEVLRSAFRLLRIPDRSVFQARSAGYQL